MFLSGLSLILPCEILQPTWSTSAPKRNNSFCWNQPSLSQTDLATQQLSVQIKAKYGMTMVILFREVFCWLPLAHVINKKILVLHGGLFSRDDVTLDDIKKIDRFRWASYVLRERSPSFRISLGEQAYTPHRGGGEGRKGYLLLCLCPASWCCVSTSLHGLIDGVSVDLLANPAEIQLSLVIPQYSCSF